MRCARDSRHAWAPNDMQQRCNGICTDVRKRSWRSFLKQQSCSWSYRLLSCLMCLAGGYYVGPLCCDDGCCIAVCGAGHGVRDSSQPASSYWRGYDAARNRFWLNRLGSDITSSWKAGRVGARDKPDGGVPCAAGCDAHGVCNSDSGVCECVSALLRSQFPCGSFAPCAWLPNQHVWEGCTGRNQDNIVVDS